MTSDGIKQQLLNEVDELLKTAPPRATIRLEVDENFEWLGRVAAVIEKWKLAKSLVIQSLLSQLRAPFAGRESSSIYQGIITLLYEARHDLRIDIGGSSNVVFNSGKVFDYFTALKERMERACEALFIIDPYLDGDFVTRYLPFVKDAVIVRLLSSRKNKKDLAGLIATAGQFCRQYKCQIEIRSKDELHDRFLLVDGREVYQSGASFKDGAVKSATNLIEVVEVAGLVRQQYEDLWASSKLEFSSTEASSPCTTHAPHTT
jgi:hypothetical protein